MINKQKLKVTALSAGLKLSQTGPEPSVLLSPVCVGGVCWNGVITRIVMLSVFMKDAAEDQSSLPEVFFRQQGQENEKIELQICFVSLEGGGKLCDRAIVKILYVCAHVYVSLGGLSGVQVVGRPFGWRPSPNIAA